MSAQTLTNRQMAEKILAYVTRVKKYSDDYQMIRGIENILDTKTPEQMDKNIIEKFGKPFVEMARKTFQPDITVTDIANPPSGCYYKAIWQDVNPPDKSEEP